MYDMIYLTPHLKEFLCKCNELGGIMARSTQFPSTITRSTIIYDIVSPGAAGLSIYICDIFGVEV